ncbi:MAG: aminodeoxychorismate lyase [Nitrosomonadales bacterium]
MLVNGMPDNLISIRDRGLLYGDGVFRTLRSSLGKALHWPMHYQKLQHDCAGLGIVCPEVDVLSSELNVLLTQHPDAVLKLIVTRGQGVRGYNPAACIKPSHIWDVGPLPDYPQEWAQRGIKAQVCQLRLSHQPRLAGIKHLNRLENVLAAAEWNDANIAEGILLDGADNVIEGTRSNLFIVKSGKLLTPDLSSCGVAGVQRERVMAWAATHNMPYQIAKFGLAELFAADEVFLLNSLIGLWPVRELEGHSWNRHTTAIQIQEWLTHAPD